jgi:RHS repeat-associated protein
MVDAAGTTGYTYDSAGRLSTVTDVHGKTITYSYNDCGLRSGWTDQFSGSVSFSYNNMHALTSMTDRNNETTTFEYDTGGRLTKLTRANGTYTQFVYSNRNLPTWVTHKKSDGTGLRNYNYTYDSAGNPTQIKKGNNDHWDFTYDNIYQLTGESFTLANGTPVYGVTYSYDNVGNRLTKVQDGQTTNYTYNNVNQMTAAGSATFTYDSNGNTASKTESQATTNYNWDYENGLTKIDNPSGDDYVYEYDGDGMRVRSGHDSGQGNVWDTRFYYDAALPLYSYLFESDDAKNMTVAYTIGPAGNLVSHRRSNATYYHHFDALGSTRLLTDASQGVTDTYDYYAFGEIQSSTGSTPNPFKFVGQLGYYDDPATEFQYLRARYYAPAVGRFTSADPIDSLPGYGYVGNAPASQSDPNGTTVWIGPPPACPSSPPPSIMPPGKCRVVSRRAFVVHKVRDQQYCIWCDEVKHEFGGIPPVPGPWGTCVRTWDCYPALQKYLEYAFECSYILCCDPGGFREVSFDVSGVHYWGPRKLSRKASHFQTSLGGATGIPGPPSWHRPHAADPNTCNPPGWSGS